EVRRPAEHSLVQVPAVPDDVPANRGQVKDGVADQLAGAMIGDVTAAIGQVELDIHLPEQVLRRAEVLRFSVAPKRDHMRMLAQERRVGKECRSGWAREY